MKRYLQYILTLSLILLANNVAEAQTAQEILSKASAKIQSASSLKATFNMTVNGKACSGTLVSKGSKFALTSNVGSSWYNGSDLWSYSPSSGETTVMKPSQSELMEINPLMYAKTSGNYIPTLSKQKTAGKHTIVLMPKQKNGGLKSVMLVLNASTYLPEKIVVTPSSGNAVTITVSNLKLGTAVSDSEFNYPKSKYPKAKVIDLR